MAVKKKIVKRKKPGSTGKGDYYHIEVRPSSDFTVFRVQDVGAKGGLERVAGKRKSGSWGTVAWLLSKKDAKVVGDKLVITGVKAKSLLKSLSAPIVRVKGDIFKSHPVKNVPEKSKPTPAMLRARRR